MAKTELAKIEDNALLDSKATAQFQVKLMNELTDSFQKLGAEVTPYGKECIINALGNLILTCKSNDIKLEDIDPIMLRANLRNIGLTELNCAAIPSEAYIDLRKTKISKVNEKGEIVETDGYSIAIKPQGAGNEALTRKYGVGIKKDTGLHKVWLIHEGDEFTMPQYNGSIVTPPTFNPKFENMDKKVIMVVYVVEKTDGSEEYLMATREGIKPNLIAQIRQNTMYSFTKDVQYGGKTYQKVDKEARQKFYDELDEKTENMSVAEILKEYKDKVNPTYTSGGSKEAMIIRKMQNNALKSYPKNYNDTLVAEAVKEMFEENDETLKEKGLVEEVDVVDAVEKQVEEKPQLEGAAKDFSVEDAKPTTPKVDDNGEVIEQKVEEKPVVEEVKEEPKPTPTPVKKAAPF